MTEQIYVGSYLKSPLDVSKLHKLNITAILSIQSERDFHSHGLSSKYLKLLCEEYRITYVTYSIEDMDAKDFILKARGALTVMR